MQAKTMSLNRIKLLAVALIFAPVIAITALQADHVRAATATSADAADTYKAKCAMCHKPDASKFFNTALSDDEMVQAILKGKKAEKPPNMPSFEAKGIDADQAKALVDYMKGLKAPSGN